MFRTMHIGCALLACALAFIAIPASAAEPVSDAQWGVYAKLVGKQGTFTDDGKQFREEYTWIDPGRMLQVQRVEIASDKEWYRAEITLSESAGKLLAEYRGRVLRGQRDILLRKDGSALWLRGGLTDPAALVEATADGGWTEKVVNVDAAGNIMHVRHELKRTPTGDALQASVDTSTAMPPIEAWGVLGRLVGTQWDLADSDRSVSYSWRQEGRELAEYWRVPDDPRYKPSVYALDPATGEISYTEVLPAWTPRWIGTVQPDGSITFVLRDNRKGRDPYRMWLADNGELHRQEGKMVDGRFVAETTKYDRHEVLLAQAESAAPAPQTPSAVAASLAPPIPATTGPAEPAVIVPTLSPAEQATRNFGPLARFDRRRLVGSDDMLEIQVLAPDTLALQYFGPDGTRWKRHLVRASADAPGKLQLLETAHGKNSRPDARLGSNRTLYVESQNGWFTGWRFRYAFTPNGDTIEVVQTTELMNGLRIALNDGATTTRTVYRPLTQQRVVQAMETSRQNAENERIAAENRRRAQAQSDANFAAFMGGLNTVAQTVQHEMAEVDRANQAVADARRAMQEAQARDQARQKAEQAAQQQARQHAQQAALTQQQANVQAAEQARRQSALDAGQQRAAQQQAADQARKKQQEEAERRRQAETQRLAEEQARQRQHEERQQALQHARNNLRLRADTCPGGGGRYYVIGPKSSAKGCATVHYEARCSGTPQGSGVQASHYNYIGGSCMGVGDAIAIPGSPLACPVEQVVVRVTNVTGC